MLDGRMTNARFGAPLLVLLTGIAIWGCDGENGFGPLKGDPPQILALSAPAQVFAGSTMDVAVTVTSELALDSVVVKVRGGFDGDGSVIFENTVVFGGSYVVSFQVPEEIRSTTATVTAYAYDRASQVSAPATDQVQLIDVTPPTVSVETDDGEVGQGGVLRITLQASDNVGLSLVGYRLLEETGDTLSTELVSVTGSSVDTTFLAPIPADLAEGTLQVEGVAVDQEGNTTVDREGAALQVVDNIAPTLEITVPTDGLALPTSLPLPISVDAEDNSGVASLSFQGFALRDNPFTGVPDRVDRFQPLEVEFGSVARDTTFSAILVAVADNTPEMAFIVATATDARGNSSADTVMVDLTPDGASVTVLEPQTGAVQPVGAPLLASVQVVDNTGIAQVTFSVISRRGEPGLGTEEEITRYQESEVEFAVPNLPRDTVLTRILAPLPDSTTENAFVRVSVVDAEGNLTQVERAIILQADETAPAVAVSGVTSPQPIGAPVELRAAIQDEGGLLTVEYEGFVLRGDPNLGTLERVDLYLPVTVDLTQRPATDTTLTRLLNPDPQASPGAELAYAVVTATDRSGNVGADTITYNLVARPPTVTILTPQDSLGFPVGDSLLMEARVTDNTGVAQVTFFGEATRGNPNLGTDVLVERFVPKSVTFLPAPRDTTVARFLVPAPDSLSEDIRLIAQALDDQGNLGADTITVRLGTPKIEILAPSGGITVQNGRGLGIRSRITDPRGIQDVLITVTGAVNDTIEYFPSQGNQISTTFLADTSVILPDTAVGLLEIRVNATNSIGISGTPVSVLLEVNEEGADDETAPRLNFNVENRARLELTDSVVVAVAGSDDEEGTGVVKVGYTVRGISPVRGDTILVSDSTVFDPPRTATVLREFSFTPFGVDSTALADTLVYEITSFMLDEAGNCAASVLGDGSDESLDCATLSGVGLNGDSVTVRVAESQLGRFEQAIVVAGRTVVLPGGGQILDAEAYIDALNVDNSKLYLANPDRGRVEVFNIRSDQFLNPIGVGSEPWGLDLNRFGDTLIVANSGGTNFSLVDVATDTEVDDDRFLTPDAVLYDVVLSEGDGGLSFEITEYPTSEAIRFSDRPQFVVQDSFGNLIYSTRTTEVGALGTIRKAAFEAGWERPEVVIGTDHTVFELVDDAYALANVDFVGLTLTTVGDTLGNPVEVFAVVIRDHVPGFPDSIIQATGDPTSLTSVPDAAAALANLGSDVIIYGSTKWNTSFTFADTTFVASSGDKGWVIVGEGGTEPVGRVLLYEAAVGNELEVSGSRQVWDNITNRSDLVFGVGLNYDGTQGVARGDIVGFFDSELRLDGIQGLAGIGTGTGAAFHPLHANIRTLDNPAGRYRPDTHVAFVGSDNRTLEIIDTWRFTRIGNVEIRDRIVGPLKAVLPFPDDNAGLTCSTVPVTDRAGNYIGDAVQLYEGGNFNIPIAPDGITDDRCIVMKLFGVTSAGGVVVVDVRKSDILRFHPAREN